jgi:hypothetical protein
MAEASDNNYEFDQPQIGGKYRISREAHELMQQRQDAALSRKVMSWVVRQHLAGTLSPLLTIDELDSIERSASPTFDERLRRFFAFVRTKDFQPSDYIRLGGTMDDAYRTQMQILTEWLDLEEKHISRFFQLTEELGLTRLDHGRVYLTAKGFERLDELRSSNRDSKQAFIAMWFETSLDEAYHKGIEPAVRATGHEPMRIDKKEHINKIDDEIIAEIRRSRFVVADFTCEKINAGERFIGVPRGGVYFEAGYAMGLKIPVIWTCRRDLIAEVHFDTRQFAHVVWDTPHDLQKNLYNRIRATIGEFAGASGLPSTLGT